MTCKTKNTQSNSIFMSLMETVKLECPSLKKGRQTFGLKTKLYTHAAYNATSHGQIVPSY
ncbi:MAG: hypothetical protein KAH18_07030 [Psychromonas sp.]|nr:hypothetical protein [Psychromonas sp.]